MIGITEGYDPVFCSDWKNWVYEKRLPAILITKNFPKLCKDNFGLLQQNCIFHVTCTGLGQSIFEPNTPNTDEIVSYLDNLSDLYKKRIVLRIDPICPLLFDCNTESFDGRLYFENLQKLLECGKRNNLRVRISFMDMYPHVLERLKEGYPEIVKYLEDSYAGYLHLPLFTRKMYLETIESKLGRKVEICGEPEMECTGCLSQVDLDLLGVNIKDEAFGIQRPACKCLALKKELIPKKERCPHNCLYCFWR